MNANCVIFHILRQILFHQAVKRNADMNHQKWENILPYLIVVCPQNVFQNFFDLQQIDVRVHLIQLVEIEKIAGRFMGKHVFI